MTVQFTETELHALRLCNPDYALAEIKKMAGVAAKEAGVTLSRVLGDDRHYHIVRVRDIVILKAHRDMGMGFPTIAAALGMERTSIGTAVKRELERRGEA